MNAEQPHRSETTAAASVASAAAGRPGTGAVAAFAKFVLFGGGVGLASSFAVAALAALMPWGLANAVITAASTLLATELHARFTFGAGRGARASRRQHLQSAGSAAAAFAATCLAMSLLEWLASDPGTVLKQAVYLSASALSGIARFALLRLVVFTRGTTPTTAAAHTAPTATAARTAPTTPALPSASAPMRLCHAA